MRTINDNYFLLYHLNFDGQYPRSIDYSLDSKGLNSQHNRPHQNLIQTSPLPYKMTQMCLLAWHP